MKINKNKNICKEETLEPVVADSRVYKQAAWELCNKALAEAKSHLHPLLQTEEVETLDRRVEFLQAFKGALEEGIARQLAFWQPSIQAVFQFNELQSRDLKCWDSTLHLLVLVTQPLSTMQRLGLQLDRNILNCLKQWNWSRFKKSKSVIEIEQVTPDEIRLGISYGAMFAAVYNAPVKIWP